eukprot:g1450.t1
MLDYDDSAFTYFFITVLCCYLVPASLATIWQIVDGLFFKSDGGKSAGSDNKKNRSEKKSTTKKGTFSSFFIFHTLVIIALWGLVFFLGSFLSENAEIAQFDPYTILDIDSGSELSVVKKAYRKLSLKYHPDRNPGDQAAQDMFVKISKAHDVLTDEDARENYEKYGNPDGRQAMQVSIGLPTFLLNKDYHGTVLIVYLIVLAVVIPVVVGFWYSLSQQYQFSDVMKGTYNTYMYFITENINLKALPEAFAGSQEFSKLKYSDADADSLVKHAKRMGGERQMMKPRRYKDKIIGAMNGLGTTLYCNNVALHLHLLGKKMPSDVVREHVDSMLVLTPKLIETMIFMTTFCGRRFWLPQTMQIVRFSQYLTQGLWIKDPNFLQLPYFTLKEASHCVRGSKGRVKGIREFLMLPKEERKGLKHFSDSVKAEINDACDRMSLFDVKVKAEVKDEEEIATNDLVTLTVDVTRLNVREGEQVRPVYAPKFPAEKFENVWILLAQPGTNNRRLASAPKKLTAQTRTLNAEMQFRAPPKPGSYTYTVHVMSDSYIGLDTAHNVTIDVSDESDLPEYEVHPDDMDLEGPMALFTDQTEGEFFEDSDSDSDEDAEDMTESQRKRRRERLNRKKAEKKGDDDEEEGELNDTKEDGKKTEDDEGGDDEDEDDDDDDSEKE